MINENKLKIFEKYDGDIDSWVRSGSKKEKSIMTDGDWYNIDAFIQDLSLVKKGLTSFEFNNVLISKFKENCDSEGAINQLKKIADKK
jgi:hypothetical protein